jgi:RNA polymerase sigma factor (sigma-70 family)
MSSPARHIYRIARSRGLTHEDAEDVAQEVILKLWQRGGGFSQGRLVTCIARRTIASFLRHELSRKRDRRRRVPLVCAENEVAPREEAAPGSDVAPWRLLRTAREEGSELAFRILRLRLEGSSYREIAFRVGRRMHDVANCLHRIKRSARGRVDRSEVAFIPS